MEYDDQYLDNSNAQEQRTALYGAVFYGIDMQRINVYHVVINFQVTKQKGKMHEANK